jgi:hypothetical protein
MFGVRDGEKNMKIDRKAFTRSQAMTAEALTLPPWKTLLRVAYNASTRALVFL